MKIFFFGNKNFKLLSFKTLSRSLLIFLFSCLVITQIGTLHFESASQVSSPEISPGHGQVIIFSSPLEKEDIVYVYIDGEILEEDYINNATINSAGTEFPLTVPEGSVFVMGDNRQGSSDSRDSRLGTVDERYLVGRAVLLLIPGEDYYTEERDWSRVGIL